MKVSTPFLAAESHIFRALFQNAGKSKKRRTTAGGASSSFVEITDFDFITFELFIECLMGFQECSVQQAVIIFPIAWKYETNNLIKKLLTILEPEVLNQNVCLSLNMALQCGCDELANNIVDFLTERRLLFRLFSEEEHYFLLDPSAVARLLQNLEMDSFTLINLFKWAENFMIKKDEPIEFRPFFTKHEIMDELTIDCFETTKAFFKFNKSELGNDFFTPKEFQEHVEINGYTSRDSAWFQVKAGDKLTEKFIIKKVVFLRNYTTIIDIYRSLVVFYDYPDEDDEEDKEEMIEFSFALKRVGSPFTLKRASSSDNASHVRKQTCTILKINLAANIVCDIEVEVDVTFNYDGRILKKSPDQFHHLTSKDEKQQQQLYFMDYATFAYKEKFNVKKEKGPAEEPPKDNEEVASEKESSSSEEEDNDDDDVVVENEPSEDAVKNPPN